MIEWLAIVAFCVQDKCGFFADTTVPYHSKEECEKRVSDMDNWLKSNGVMATITGCVPIKFTKV